MRNEKSTEAYQAAEFPIRYISRFLDNPVPVGIDTLSQVGEITDPLANHLHLIALALGADDRWTEEFKSHPESQWSPDGAFKAIRSEIKVDDGIDKFLLFAEQDKKRRIILRRYRHGVPPLAEEDYLVVMLPQIQKSGSLQLDAFSRTMDEYGDSYHKFFYPKGNPFGHTYDQKAENEGYLQLVQQAVKDLVEVL